MHRTIRFPLAVLALCLVVTLFTAPAWQRSQSVDAADGAPQNRQAFHDGMRKLWEDHITWTRLFIVSKATLRKDLPDIGPTVDRLLQNQTDIGNAIAPFYGADAAADLTALLRVHILTAADILTAAKAGDAEATNAAIEAWYANAHDIAVFLHELNPQRWSLAELDAMMDEHLDLTLVEAVARLEGRYADDVTAYEDIHLQILDMADMLSDGIIAQFPQMFAGGS
jgi:hypothetical protein